MDYRPDSIRARLRQVIRVVGIAGMDSELIARISPAEGAKSHGRAYSCLLLS